MTNKNDCLSNHEFVLSLSGVDQLDERLTDALFEAGCDDATPALRNGTIYLHFDREALSLKEAIISAIRDVLKSGVGASVQHIDDCDLVTQAEIARRIDKSRQLIGQYVSGATGPGKFPGAVCNMNEGQPLWAWSEVAHWLYEARYIDREKWEASRVVAAVNGALDYVHQKNHDAALVEDIVGLFAPMA